MAPRPRNPENKKLPERWRFYHGAYRYMVPLGDEQWWDGKKQFTLGRTLTQAFDTWAKRLNAKKAAEDEAAIAEGKPPIERATPRTIREGLERYLREVTPLKKSPRTRKFDRDTIPLLIARFGHFPIAGPGMPEPRHIYEYVSHRKNKRTGERAITAAHHEMELFFAAYTKFVEWGCLNVHPFHGNIRLTGENAIPRNDQRYVEDWEIEKVLSLKSRRKKGSVRMCQAYIQLKLELKGLRMTDMLMLKPEHATEEGIKIWPSKTRNSTGLKRLYRWTPERRRAWQACLDARPLDIAPWLFCTRDGKPYLDENLEASSFESVWQRFMDRAVKELGIQRFKERDIRAKVGSDAETIQEAQYVLGHSDPSVTRRHYRRKPEVIK